MNWNILWLILFAFEIFIPNAIGAASRGLVISSIKVTVAGASNTIDAAYNSNQSVSTQASGHFKATATVSNVGVSGSSADSTNNAGGFATDIQPSYDSTKTINILTIQFGGGNSGDLTSDPASVATYYNNLVGIAQKWKALGSRTKVVVFTPWSYGDADSATATNYINANGLIMADHTNFDAVIISGNASPVFSLGIPCPDVAITADCNHLTQAGQALLLNAYEVGVNSTF